LGGFESGYFARTALNCKHERISVKSEQFRISKFRTAHIIEKVKYITLPLIINRKS
jgi:hypothetical protein